MAALGVMVVTALLTSYAEIPSPLKQLKAGTAPEEIQCRHDRVLVIRKVGSPACVYQSTAEKKGWQIVATEMPKEVSAKGSSAKDPRTDSIIMQPPVITSHTDDQIVTTQQVTLGGTAVANGTIIFAPFAPDKPNQVTAGDVVSRSLEVDSDGMWSFIVALRHEGTNTIPIQVRTDSGISDITILHLNRVVPQLDVTITPEVTGPTSQNTIPFTVNFDSPIDPATFSADDIVASSGTVQKLVILPSHRLSLGTIDQFNEPYGMVVDQSGRIYVADTGNNRISVFDGTGEHQLSFGSSGSGDGQFDRPLGVAVDQSGRIYVADAFNHRISVFDGTGEHQLSFGSYGSGDGQFIYPLGMAVDQSGRIYVADTGNNRISVFDGTGEHQLSFGSSGSGDGQFNYPSRVAVDQSGRIYVADAFNYHISVFDGTGEHQLSFGSLGSGDGQFNSPSGVAVDQSGRIYVADTYNHRIQIFDSSTAYTFEVADADSQATLSVHMPENSVQDMAGNPNTASNVVEIEVDR